MGEFIVSILMVLFIWIIMLPISFIAATPFLPIYSAFGKEGYFTNLGNKYRYVYAFWIELGDSATRRI